MTELLLKIFGWKEALFHGDPTTYDRYRWLRKHLAKGAFRTLEAGCGTGVMVFYAGKINKEALGISFDKRNMEVATQRAKLLRLNNVKFIEGDLRKLDQFSNLGKFDQVVCFECIEHILNDEKLIRDLSSLLKPGGKLLLTTPYEGYRPLLGDDPAEIKPIENGGHVRWGYGFEAMRTLFENAGLKVEAEDYVSGMISQKVTNIYRWLHLRFNVKLAWLLILPLRPLVALDSLFTKLFRYPYLSIAVLGVKVENFQLAQE